MQVYFTVNVGGKFWDSSWCPLNRVCLVDMGLLNTGFIV